MSKKNKKNRCVIQKTHYRWRDDSVECTLPRALFSPVRADASVSAKGPGPFQWQQKARHKVIGQKEEVEFLDAWTESRLWMGVYHDLLLFFSFFLRLSLLLTVFDRIRQVNEKQHGKTTAALHSACTCHSVYLRVCIPVSTRVWLPCVLRRASLSKTMMIQYESNEKPVHTFRSRSVRWSWI